MTSWLLESTAWGEGGVPAAQVHGAHLLQAVYVCVFVASSFRTRLGASRAHPAAREPRAMRGVPV